MGGHPPRTINGKLPAIDRVPWQRHPDVVAGGHAHLHHAAEFS